MYRFYFINISYTVLYLKNALFYIQWRSLAVEEMVKNALEPAYRIESPEAIPCCPQLRYSNKNYVQGRM